jgi:hypothetical protein
MKNKILVKGDSTVCHAMIYEEAKKISKLINQGKIGREEYVIVFKTEINSNTNRLHFVSP